MKGGGGGGRHQSIPPLVRVCVLADLFLLGSLLGVLRLSLGLGLLGLALASLVGVQDLGDTITDGGLGGQGRKGQQERRKDQAKESAKRRWKQTVPPSWLRAHGASLFRLARRLRSVRVVCCVCVGLTMNAKKMAIRIGTGTASAEFSPMARPDSFVGFHGFCFSPSTGEGSSSGGRGRGGDRRKSESGQLAGVGSSRDLGQCQRDRGRPIRHAAPPLLRTMRAFSPPRAICPWVALSRGLTGLARRLLALTGGGVSRFRRRGGGVVLRQDERRQAEEAQQGEEENGRQLHGERRRVGADTRGAGERVGSESSGLTGPRHATSKHDSQRRERKEAENWTPI